MNRREEAEKFIYALRSCVPKTFFSKVEKSQKGISFVLFYLEKSSGEVIAGDLAKELHVSTARIAVLLKKMEKNHLIIKRSSPVDARRTIVEITPEGRAYVGKIKEENLIKAELLLEKVGKEELDEFIRIVSKIKKALEE